MSEDFLHYLWYNRLFYPSGITTVGGGDEVEVIHPGWPNRNAGPDFFNSRIRIGKTLWAGNVEIHIKSSDWFNHNHQSDEAYNNVVLHVVAYSDGVSITDSKGREIPEIVLGYNPAISDRYNSLMHHLGVIKCNDQVGKLPSIEIYSWLERMLMERMEQRSLHIFKLLDQFGGNWDQVFFVMLSRAMGLGVNGDPFEILARSIPVNILMRLSDNLLQLEALLFGQAGFLDKIDSSESYPVILKREYDLLRHKYALSPMNVSQWKFMRLRPANFPTVRISQLAAILHNNPGNFESWVVVANAKHFLNRLSVEASGYWKSHYLFNKPVDGEGKIHLGTSSRKLLVINALLPYCFAMAHKRGQTDIQEQVLKLFSEFPVESNSIIRQWRQAGIDAGSAGESQALVYLYQNYCVIGKCLQCRVGHLIVNGDEKQRF